jgi:hypothetical protein
MWLGSEDLVDMLYLGYALKVKIDPNRKGEFEIYKIKIRI